jgi:DNA-binding transcriptional ArsR family regulator
VVGAVRRAFSGFKDTPTEAQFDAALEMLELLAEPTRLRILWALAAGELDVTTVAGMAGASTTATSQHLAKLRQAGLVASRRDGRRIMYRVLGRHTRSVIEEVLFHADHRLSGHPDHD